MNYRRQPPKRNKPPRFGSKRTSFGSKRTSLGKSIALIGIPAALFGAFAALALNLYSPNSTLPQQIRDLVSQAADTASPLADGEDPAAAPRNRARLAGPPDIVCRSPRVTDGDTLRCGEIRIRLEGIDSPEMGGKCRPGRQCVDGDPDAAKANLQALVSRDVMECTQSDVDRYGRIVARCVVAHVDLSCEQVRTGHAIYRYAPIDC